MSRALLSRPFRLGAAAGAFYSGLLLAAGLWSMQQRSWELARDRLIAAAAADPLESARALRALSWVAEWSRPVSRTKTRDFGSMRCIMSSSTMPSGAPNEAERARRV